jgi:hypothetical protein
MSIEKDLLTVHSRLVDEADLEMDYEAAWLYRFDAGYSAALIDMLAWLGRGDSPLQKASDWVNEFEHWLPESEAD